MVFRALVVGHLRLSILGTDLFCCCFWSYS